MDMATAVLLALQGATVLRDYNGKKALRQIDSFAAVVSAPPNLGTSMRRLLLSISMVIGVIVNVSGFASDTEHVTSYGRRV